jgi:hypothetical protein
MEQNKPDPIQPVSLEVGDMHGPITTMIDIYVMLPDGRVGKLQTRMAVGVIPTRAEIKAVLDATMTPESIKESSIPAGTRLLTKPEFIAHILKMEGGAELPMPGDQQFVAVPGDIPHQMLIYAVMGAPVPGYLMSEYIDRGLAKYVGPDDRYVFTWGYEKLDALPEGVLRAIYERITS